MFRKILVLFMTVCGIAYADRPIQQLVLPRANPYVKPSYESHKVEIQKFSGCFASIAPWTPVSFTLISDDGSDLWVDGVKVIGHLWSWQHLPNRAQSTHRYPATGGVVYGNKVHCITVVYRNAAYDPKSPGERGHQDGATLVAPWLRVVPCPKNDADLNRRMRQGKERQAKEEADRKLKEAQEAEANRKKLLDQIAQKQKEAELKKLEEEKKQCETDKKKYEDQKKQCESNKKSCEDQKKQCEDKIRECENKKKDLENQKKQCGSNATKKKECDAKIKEYEDQIKQCTDKKKQCESTVSTCTSNLKKIENDLNTCTKKEQDLKTRETKLKGNNGVGNGLDPQPPGNPPVNDGPGTSPGNPGNKQGGNKK